MATRKSKTYVVPSKYDVLEARASGIESIGTVTSTFSGPSTKLLDDSAAARMPTVPEQRLATQKVGAQLASAAMPSNPLKPTDIGLANGHAPEAGSPVEPHDPIDTASTVTENVASAKVGDGVPPKGYNPATNHLTGCALTREARCSPRTWASESVITRTR